MPSRVLPRLAVEGREAETPVWRSLLPDAVSVVAATDAMRRCPLWPGEHAYIERAVPTRQAEFRAGRAAARAALARLGMAACAVPAGPGREPCWPAGVVGSIAHKADHCAAAVARRDAVLALGIDVERLDALEPVLAHRICRDDEARGGAWPGVVFSAKESFHKAYFPATGRTLDYHDVRVTFEDALGTFVAELCDPAAPALHGRRRVAGCYAVAGGFVFTAIALPAPPLSAAPPRGPR